jgi:hypothetical protein
MKLADDLLPGAGAIADYVYGHDDPENRRKVYYQYEKVEKAKETKSEKDTWPLWKDGQEITSRKSLLDSHFQPKGKIQIAE